MAQNGFTNVQITPGNYAVTASGTVAAAQQAFNTQLGVFSNVNGQSGLGNTSAIQVPAGLSQIEQVLGLDTVTQAQTFMQMSAQKINPAYFGTGNADGYYPDGFATVYNRPSSQTGRNTVAALIGWGSMANPVNDLAQLEAQRGIAAVPTSIVPANSGGSTDDGEQLEWGMDAQAIVGISGGVKQLIFYTSGGSGGSGAQWDALYNAINQAVSDNTAKAINMSWGAGECGSVNGYFDTLFQRGISQGQTFSAASGDNGAYPCGAWFNGSYGNPSEPSAEYPASSPYVIAIGGTTLSTGANLAYGSESAWAYSGGGVGLEGKPAWQSGLSGSARQVPDLAFDADPYTPGLFYYTASADSGISSSGWYGVGGTSLSSPLFVGAWAALQSANGNTLGFAPQLVYPAATQLQATAALHDVTSGYNGYYSAKVGYDNVTGWGSFDITKMLAFVGNPTGTYTVTASAGTGGTISPSGMVTLSYGTTKAFTITPNTGHDIAIPVGGTCGGTLSGNIYTINAITANCTVTPTFMLQNFIVAASAAGGTATPTSQSVNWGSKATLTLTPATDHSLPTTVSSAVFGGNCPLGTISGSTYTTGAITASCTISVTFPVMPSIRASVSGTGGAISPSGKVTVNYGATQAFTIMPNTGYNLVTPRGTCNGTLSGNIYTTNAITSDCTVVASFAPIIYTITTSANAGGTISPLSATGIFPSAQRFTFAPDNGYIVTMGGTCAGTRSGNIYTVIFSANCTVTAQFTKGTYTVTPNVVGTGGTISPATPVSVKNNGAVSFTLKPSAGYAPGITSAGCGGVVLSGSGNTVKISQITSDCTLTETFAVLIYTVTPSVSGTGGTISPATGVFIRGTETTSFTLTPSTGYVASSVGGTCGGTLSGNTFTTKAITANCTVIAKFVQGTYIVTPSVPGTGGTISPATNVSVKGTATTSFTLKPTAGYVASSVSGTCVGALSGNTFKTNPITANCTVIASFTPGTYTVTPSVSGTGGTISPATGVSTKGLTSTTFTLAPNAGYVASSVSGTCGGTLSGNTFTTKAIAANCTVIAKFAQGTYTVIPSVSGTGGTINPAKGVSVKGTATTLFTLKPSAGYAGSVSGTCGGTLSGNTFKINPIVGNCTVVATFAQ